MSHHNIIKFLKTKNKQIDFNGVIRPLITRLDAHMFSVVIATLMVNFYHIYHFYHQKLPITLYCNSLYSHFTEQLLILNKTPYYKIYKPFMNNITYYTSSKKKTVNINPLVIEWSNRIVPFIPLCDDDLLTISN